MCCPAALVLFPDALFPKQAPYNAPHSPQHHLFLNGRNKLEVLTQALLRFLDLDLSERTPILMTGGRGVLPGCEQNALSDLSLRESRVSPVNPVHEDCRKP